MPVWLGISDFFRRRSAKFILASLITVVAIILVIFTPRAWWGKPVFFAKRDAAARQKLDTVVETEVIKITPSGFEPTEITRPEGPIRLFVNDQTGFGEVALRLDRVTGGRLREVKIHKSKPLWAELFDLAPGQYALTEANNADWTCRITITAK